MKNSPQAHAGPHSQIAATPLQDHLLLAIDDLGRLQGLLSDAGQRLMHRFSELQRVLDDAEPRSTADALAEVRRHLWGAVRALQFQDLAWQHIHHIRDRLVGCTTQIALRSGLPDDALRVAVASMAAVRHSPVAQADMDSGSVELF